MIFNCVQCTRWRFDCAPFLTSNCQSPVIPPRLQWCHSSLWRWQSSWMFGLLVGMPSTIAMDAVSTWPSTWALVIQALLSLLLPPLFACSATVVPSTRRRAANVLLIARLMLMVATRNPWREQYRHCWLIHPQLPLLNQPPHHLLHLLRPLLQWRSPLLLLWLPGQQQFLSVTDAQQPLKMNAV